MYSGLISCRLVDLVNENNNVFAKMQQSRFLDRRSLTAQTNDTEKHFGQMAVHSSQLRGVLAVPTNVGPSGSTTNNARAGMLLDTYVLDGFNRS